MVSYSISPDFNGFVISPHFDEILDTFETKPETGELIFPRLEGRPGGFEIRPTVLTPETVASLESLRRRIGHEIRSLAAIEEMPSDFIRLTPVWECLLGDEPKNDLYAVRHHYTKQIDIQAEGDCTRIETIEGELFQNLSGKWETQNSRVSLLQYNIEMDLKGLHLFLDLPRPIDPLVQVRLLLATLGVADFEIRGRVFLPSAMSLTFTPKDGPHRPLEGEALRLWNWVRDGIVK